MESTLSQRGIKFLLITALLFTPFSTRESYDGDYDKSYRNLSAEPIIANLRASSEKESPADTKPVEGLSDTWKYIISGLVMVFFLSLALFIQLRAEREK